MADASASFDFEAAASLRDWKDLLVSRAERPGRLAPRVFDRDAVVAVLPPHREPELVVLKDGLPVAFGVDMEALEILVGAIGTADGVGVIGREEAEDAHVVAHWAHLHREHAVVVTRGAEEGLQNFAGRVREHLTVPA